jgi:hypothetical protein
MRSRMAARDILCNVEFINACTPEAVGKVRWKRKREQKGTGRRRIEKDMRSDHTNRRGCMRERSITYRLQQHVQLPVATGIEK